LGKIQVLVQIKQFKPIKMKTKHLLLVITVCTICFTACKKTKIAENIEEVETTFDLSGKQAISDNLTQDANDVLEEAAADNNLNGITPSVPNTGSAAATSNNLGGCAVVTVTGNFPAKNIKVDFGNGCTNAAGVTRKGVINIVLTDSVRKTGSVATATFADYFVNGYKKEGIVTWTNTTVAGSGTPSWNRKVENGKITAPNGDYWLHTANISITFTAGAATPKNLIDDVFSILGTRTITNSAGKIRTSTTLAPLQKKTACSNIDKGTLQVQGPNHTAVIDFGDGSCDKIATISIDGKASRTILLR
jgi:hypothetical protein